MRIYLKISVSIQARTSRPKFSNSVVAQPQTDDLVVRRPALPAGAGWFRGEAGPVLAFRRGRGRESAVAAGNASKKKFVVFLTDFEEGV